MKKISKAEWSAKIKKDDLCAEIFKLSDLLGNEGSQPFISEIWLPNYQRNFSWDEEKVGSLFQNVLMDFKDSKKNFVGSFIFHFEPTGYFAKYHLIDGQQRVSSLMLILLCCFERLQNSKDAYSKKARNRIIETIACSSGGIRIRREESQEVQDDLLNLLATFAGAVSRSEVFNIDGEIEKSISSKNLKAVLSGIREPLHPIKNLS